MFALLHQIIFNQRSRFENEVIAGHHRHDVNVRIRAPFAQIHGLRFQCRTQEPEFEF